MHEDAVARADVVRLGDERERREALHGARGADADRDRGWEREDGGPVGERVLCERPRVYAELQERLDQCAGKRRNIDIDIDGV